MTISTTTSRQSYNGNGVTTEFAIPFRFFANTDLVVQLVTISTGASTTLTLTTHYTVTGADDEDGGMLTMVTAPAVGQRLVIRRVIAATQEVDYVAGDPFPAETHERALDRLTMLAQQGEEVNARALVFPAGDTASGELPAVATRASRLLGFDSSGNLVTSAPASGSAAELAIDLAGTGGAGLVGFQQTGAGAVARTLQSKGRDVVSVRDFGAVGDGVADDTAEIQAAINATPAYSVLDLQGGIYVISATLTVPTDYIGIQNGRIIAAAGSQFEFMLSATGRTGVVIRDIEFDANGPNRIGGQSVRHCGAAFITCTDCSFINVTALNARGYNNVSGIGLTAAGQSTRCLIQQCRLIDCGEAGNIPATDGDGVFTSGTQNVISNCIGVNCTDVSFVIENSNCSVISGCSSLNSYCGAAITAAGTEHRRGNIIHGLTVGEWEGANTGGVQLGTIGSGSGNLYDTIIGDVTIYTTTPTRGNGAAILVRQGSGGKTIGLNINNVRVSGSNNQGILVTGDSVVVSNTTVQGTTDACIQFQNTSTACEVNTCRLIGGSFGVAASGNAVVRVTNSQLQSQSSNALYAFSTAQITSIENNPSSNTYGADAGARIFTFNEPREITLTYSASIDTNAALGDLFQITATNGTSFNITAPTNATFGKRISYRIKNAAGGALGEIIWSGAFKLAAWTQPANGFSRSITYEYDGTSWVEVSRTSADVPN
jgi:hypothetical protein